MEDIQIERYQEDPEVRGCVHPLSGKWQLLIDHDDTPHLLIRCQVEHDSGEVVPGWIALDDLLPEGLLVKDMMLSVFGKESSEEEPAVPDAE